MADNEEHSDDEALQEDGELAPRSGTSPEQFESIAKQTHLVKQGGIGVNQRSRLSVMPLAVLLPTVSKPAALHEFHEKFEKRLETLRGAKDELTKEEVAEETMLNQIMQWLNQTIS